MPLTKTHLAKYLASAAHLTHQVFFTDDGTSGGANPWTPMAGRLLTIFVVANATLGASNPVTSAPSSVAATKVDGVVGNTDTDIYFLVAAGNEASLSITLTSSQPAAVVVIEDAGALASPRDAHNSHAASAQFPITGITGITTQADEKAYAVWGEDQAGAYSGARDSGSGSLALTWTSEASGSSTSGSGDVTIAVASAPLSAVGSVEAQITCASTNVQTGVVATFKAAPPAGAGVAALKQLLGVLEC